MKQLLGFFLILQIMGCASSVSLPTSPGPATSTDAKTFPFILNEKSGPIQTQRLKFTTHGPYTESEAKQFFSGRQLAITQLLEPKIDPYKGEDSTPAVCRKENLPKEIKTSGKNFSIALALYSSEHMILGACSDSQNLLKTQYQMLYCGNNGRAYIIQYYYPPLETWRSDFIANCLP